MAGIRRVTFHAGAKRLRAYFGKEWHDVRTRCLYGLVRPRARERERAAFSSSPLVLVRPSGRNLAGSASGHARTTRTIKKNVIARYKTVRLVSPRTYTHTRVCACTQMERSAEGRKRERITRRAVKFARRSGFVSSHFAAQSAHPDVFDGVFQR